MDASRRHFLLARRPALAQEDGRVQVGPACLALHGVECRICAEVCESRALRFVPARGGIAQMRIDLAACTGCADCVAPCPVGAVHMTAQAPDQSTTSVT